MQRVGRTVVAALALLTSAVADTGAAQELPFVLARYVLTHNGRAERLELIRTERRIEYRYLDRAVTEVWERDARGQLSHWKVFHKAARVVHYTPGDLRTIHVEPSWQRLASLLDTDEKVARTSLRLLHVEPCTVISCARVMMGEYQEIEFADLGDKENDPFVRRFSASFGHAHRH